MPRTGSPGRELAWLKARKSAGNGACVELAPVHGMVAIRDSKDPEGPAPWYTAAEWEAFLGRRQEGRVRQPRLSRRDRSGKVREDRGTGEVAKHRATPAVGVPTITCLAPGRPFTAPAEPGRRRAGSW